jgi:hypothetical protein
MLLHAREMEVCGEYYNMESRGPGLNIQALERGPSVDPDLEGAPGPFCASAMPCELELLCAHILRCRRLVSKRSGGSGGAALRRLRLACVLYPVGFCRTSRYVFTA